MLDVSASTCRVSDLIKAVDDRTLVLKPPFQRRLVWTNIVKDHFLETVALGLPFPEIFVATGEIDTQTMKRKNLLVDGQQRISTLRQYVQGAEDLALSKVKPYANLTEKEKAAFLDYKVAVRDLGTVTDEQIKDIFSRINSTDYALNAIERLNARFSGAYKQFCDKLSQHAFFDRHNVFSMADMRRMRDLDFCVILTTTLLSTYYHRDELNKEYLQRYNDAFPKSRRLEKDLGSVFEFIDRCDFPTRFRAWKKTDLLTLIVELYTLLIVKKSPLDAARVKEELERFYDQVDETFKMGGTEEERESVAPSRNVFRYLKAATKATNDKYARLDRAEVVADILESTISSAPKKAQRQSSKKAQH